MTSAVTFGQSNQSYYKVGPKPEEAPKTDALTKKIDVDFDKAKKLCKDALQLYSVPVDQPESNILSVDPKVNKAIFEANAFLKKINRHYKLESHPSYEKEYRFLRRTIICAKLGGNIIPKILEENPDYEQFILDHHWHNAAVRYNQVLPVYPEWIDKKEILSPGLILSNDPLDKNMHFSTFKAIHGLEKKTCVINSGLIFHDQHHFKHMVSNDVENPAAWNHQYVVEIMTDLNAEDEEKPLCDDHSWLRLKTPEGAVCTFGIYGPKMTIWERLKNRFNVTLKATADNPDRIETMDKNATHFHGTVVAIAKEKFETLKAEMEKISQKGVAYGFLKSNCTGHIKRLLYMVGIQIESTMTTTSFIAQYFASKKVRQILDKIVPQFIQDIFRAIGQFFLGIFLWINGVGSRDKDVKEAWGDEFQADIPKIKDMFKTTHVEHPLALRKWQYKIDNWRTEKTKKLLSKIKTESNKDNPDDAAILKLSDKLLGLPFALPKNNSAIIQ